MLWGEYSDYGDIAMKEKFSGFSPPVENWSKLPHEFIDLLPVISSLGEIKVILYILRHTWGFQDDSKKITLDEFQNGRKRKDGTRLDNGVGLSKPAIREGIKRAVYDGFLEIEEDASDKARIKRWYSLKIRGKESLPLVETKFTPGGNKVYPDQRKKPLKDTKEPLGGSANPGGNGIFKSKHEGKKIFEQYRKYLIYRRPDDPDYQDPRLYHPALRLYRGLCQQEVTKRGDVRDRVIKVVGSKKPALELWRKSINVWVATSDNFANVGRVISIFENGGELNTPDEFDEEKRKQSQDQLVSQVDPMARIQELKERMNDGNQPNA